jgi:trehalose-6-phosphate synthase
MSATGRIILVSNRGPVQYGREGGERTANRGAGGLVTALSGLSRHLQDGVWVCEAMSDEDVIVAKESPGGLYPPELGDDDLRGPAELLARADMAVDGPHGALELLDRLVELLDRPATEHAQ